MGKKTTTRPRGTPVPAPKTPAAGQQPPRKVTAVSTSSTEQPAGWKPSTFAGALLVQVTAGIILLAITYLVAHIASVWR
ncbi:hypothetical protein ACFVFS_26585 [Kitasatospora sp. NPDC057692]|uniref:hypothetical protein n=1 Tax=Kitasatospora sp. NPDC057692 TaxID=3346215 RepID=UPI00368CA1BB